MVQKIHSLVLGLMLLPALLFAEGSKQLTPGKSSEHITSINNDVVGYLAHDANFASASGVGITSLSFMKPASFSRNGAVYSKEHRLYIRVKAGERLYYGVHRAIHDHTSSKQTDLTITLRRTNVATGQDDAGFVDARLLKANTNSTRSMLLMDNQAGVIHNATEVENGPNRSINGKSVSNGYNPIVIHNNTDVDYDYYVEFTQTGESSWTDDGRRFSIYDLWDFTVIDATGSEKPGRMRSKLWSFSAGGMNTVLSKNFNLFPLIPSTDQTGKYFVKRIEIGGIIPHQFFRFVANQFGSTTEVGTSIADRRKSQANQKDYPQYFSFVNNPDESIWPTASIPSFSVTIAYDCNANANSSSGKAIFNILSNEAGTTLVLVNLNGVEGYQPNTEDVLLEASGPKGIRTVEWNGINGKGQVISKNTQVQYQFLNGSGRVNLPLWDVEKNEAGLKIRSLRPITNTNQDALLFWDDSNLPLSSFPAPQTELFGAVSTNGAHKWGFQSTKSGDLRTVNSWAYGHITSLQKTEAFVWDCSADVAVTYSAASASYAVGKEFAYTISVTNNGPAPASSLKVVNTLEAAKLQFIKASDAAYNSDTKEWNVGTLALGATKKVELTVRPIQAGNVVSSVNQTHAEPDPVSSNNNASLSITVSNAADIAVINGTDKKSYVNGDVVTYTMKVTNLGPEIATGVAVATDLPDGFVPLQGNTPEGFNTTTGVWTAGTLNVNETKSLTLQARVTKVGTYTGHATLQSRTGYQLDTNISNDTSSNTVSVLPVAEVEVLSSVSESNPGQEEEIRYTVKVINHGPDNASNVSLSSQIPAGVSVTKYEASAGNVDAATGNWEIGNIGTEASQSLIIYARTGNTGTYTANFIQTHPEFDKLSANNAASSTITVKPSVDVALSNVIMSSPEDIYEIGDEVTYEIKVKNNGPGAATNVFVIDKLSDALSYVGSTHSNGTGAYDGVNGKWSVGTLNKGASAVLTLTAKVNKSGVITTKATHSLAEYDNISGNNSASTSFISGSGTIISDIQVTTTASPAPYYTGKEISLLVKVDNIGPHAATEVQVKALVPNGFILKSSTPQTGIYDEANGIWQVGKLAYEAHTELLLVGVPQVDNTALGEKTYAFVAEKMHAYEEDPVSSNNASTTNLTVKKAADVAMSISVAGDQNGVFYNGVTEATFLLTVTNQGPDKVTNLEGYDTRTGFLNFTYVESGKGFEPTTGKWTVGTLLPNESRTLLVKGISNTTGHLHLGGKITFADQADSNLENNSAIAILHVLPAADLQLTYTPEAGPYYNGKNTIITVSVKNISKDAATGVKIEDVLPAGLTLIGSKASAGTYNAATGIWNLETDLLAGTTHTLALTVRPTKSQSFTSIATVVSENEHDRNTNDNSASITFEVQKSADVALEAIVSEGPYLVGGTYSVVITAKNHGPDVASGVVVASAIAHGIEVDPTSIKVSPGTTPNPLTGTWTIGGIGVDETKTMSLTFTIQTTGTLESTGFKFSQNEYDPNGGNTRNGNNTALTSFYVEDRKAQAQVFQTNKHKFFFETGQVIAAIKDQDGPVQHARILNRNLPAGTRLLNSGELLVDYKHELIPGSYTLTVETTDESGGVSESTFTYVISGDWDHDGVDDVHDLDDNNDGIITEPNAVDPTGDHDNDGTYNYLDKDFIHPVYGSFLDVNNDDIHDGFDLDHDGLIRGYDVDIDGDGIYNAIEANNGKVPTGFNLNTGTFDGQVSSNGIPLAVQTSDNSGIINLSNADTDGDGYKDYQDADSDNDGIQDNVEVQPSLNSQSSSGIDSDADGIDDVYDPTCGCGSNGLVLLPVNTESEDTPDYLDLNSDNDLYEDFVESLDDDNDGVTLGDYKQRAADFEERTTKGFYLPEDVDNDGIPNWLEREGIAFAFLTPGNIYYHDTDQDGLVDLFDQESRGAVLAQHLVLNSTTNDYEYAARTNETVIPLPVHLIRFTANTENSGVLLSWLTASEKNNDYFIVERSLDGKIFHSIGQVKGAGNSSRLTEYTYLDRSTIAGVAYYRLKQVDFDGKLEFSKVISVQIKNTVNSLIKDINLYPNPATNQLNLDLSNLPLGLKEITISSTNGRIMQKVRMESGKEQQLDISELAAGVYLIRIDGESQSWNARFVKR